MKISNTAEPEGKLHKIREWLKDRHVGQAFQPAINLPELRPFSKEDLPAVAFCRRKLPHWELEGCTYFVTFRVHKALGAVLEDLSLAVIAEEALWHGYGERYLLHAYVIMPDHVHLLLQPVAEWALAKILQGLKGFTARQINRLLGRKGEFWQDESFDHLVRNEEDWFDKFDYIHNNPVKAGLVERPQDYPFSSLVTMHSNGRLESLPHNNG
jgi:REP element-mobilizing transposase RayT